MKLLRKAKDGGPDSTVTGYWLVEIKGLFSVVLLKFEDGSRDAYHSHAFHSLNWVLKGEVHEHLVDEMGKCFIKHRAGLRPILTKRSTCHKVVSLGTTWVLSIRGPWNKYWFEYNPQTFKVSTLTHGRKVVV